ncbi:MAG TPA: TRAP transporter fused permease subunit [Candidatus Polarisedimenticolaceae bacterium]|nr:TRAP transporter fused permease subunit [Candidatus Polarisedimenticolaceae bacterium]
MADEVIDSSRIEAAKEIAEQEEGPRRRLAGPTSWLAAGLAAAMSLLFIYWAWATVTTQILRLVFLAFTLVLTFVLYPPTRKGRHRGVSWFDWILIALSLLAIGYPLWDFEEFIYRAALPDLKDQIFGALTIVLVLEATRRTTGWILPVVALVFLAYAWLGVWLPSPWTHQGYGLDRLVGHMYMTLEGIFGVPLDVAATFIILFTIYGAVLEHSKAGEFFVNFSMAATGSRRTAAGRTVTLASFLLGGPSGSGVATTITVGSVAYPLLAKAGYDKDSAGGLLAAGGIGAIISPPVLGAAAFLIAEFLRISYLEVIALAAIPTLLFYWSIFVMVELDAHKFGARPVTVETESVWSLTRKYGYHFISLVAIVIFMLWGYTAILSVVYAMVVSVALSFLRPETALTPPRLWRTLIGGSTGVLSVAATCAAAGIIVGVVTLTGLGLKFSMIILTMSGGNLFLTIAYTGLAVWILGLAMPVTASYIIAAVITAPAMIKLGVPDYAAHMFIFYYAVLSEVSPPTALSPFAAAAITGGNPYKTTMMAWKYTLPTFLVPFMFTLHADGAGLLLKGPWENIAWTSVTAAVGLAALAAGLSGWMLMKTTWLERGLLLAGGLVLVYPSLIQDVIGFVLIASAGSLQYFRRRTGETLRAAH